MGQAKQRGSFEDRKAQSLQRVTAIQERYAAIAKQEREKLGTKQPIRNKMGAVLLLAALAR